MANRFYNCPLCNSVNLYGPISDYYGVCCVDCGYEIERCNQVINVIVGKDFYFEAAHSLPNLPEDHKCRNLHGHSYRFRVEIEGTIDERGFVIDYADISKAIDPIVTTLDHKNLNDLFLQPTTAENIAMWLFHNAQSLLGSCKRITLWETPTSVVTIET